MDRRQWLQERRADVVAAYGAEASHYQEYPNDAPRRWVDRLLEECPSGGVILDAPCGTGRYFSQIAAAGLAVVGVDQSAVMLEEAAKREVAASLHHVGLQELGFIADFDAALTIDAMENIPPEQWPLVLANLHRAVRPEGLLYMTVEETEPAELDAAFAQLTAAGLPAVRGEIIEGDVAGYHYYPAYDEVMTWFARAGWHAIAEDYTAEDGWGYRHFMLRRVDTG